MVCVRIREFESYIPSHAVWSLRTCLVVSTARPRRWQARPETVNRACRDYRLSRRRHPTQSTCHIPLLKC